MPKQPLPVAHDFETKVLKLFERVGRGYLLIGEVSLDTGYSLSVVEYQLDDLSSRGAVRRLAFSERKALGLHDMTEAFALVDPGKFTVVAWSDYC